MLARAAVGRFRANLSRAPPGAQRRRPSPFGRLAARSSSPAPTRGDRSFTPGNWSVPAHARAGRKRLDRYFPKSWCSDRPRRRLPCCAEGTVSACSPRLRVAWICRVSYERCGGRRPSPRAACASRWTSRRRIFYKTFLGHRICKLSQSLTFAASVRVARVGSPRYVSGLSGRPASPTLRFQPVQPLEMMRRFTPDRSRANGRPIQRELFRRG